jgi:kynurenine formamidase
LSNATPVYPGDALPTLEPTACLDRDGFCDARLTTTLHVGTHLDGPAHVLPAAPLLAALPVERFCGRGVLVDARGRATIDADLLATAALRAGDAVLVYTGWAERFGTADYFAAHPTIQPAFAAALAQAGVHLLGLDTPSPDRAPYDVHRQLLAARVLIAENLTGLDNLLGQREVEVVALPIKLDADSAPARVVARLP